MTDAHLHTVRDTVMQHIKCGRGGMVDALASGVSPSQRGVGSSPSARTTSGYDLVAQQDAKFVADLLQDQRFCCRTSRLLLN